MNLQLRADGTSLVVDVGWVPAQSKGTHMILAFALENVNALISQLFFLFLFILMKICAHPFLCCCHKTLGMTPQ